MSNRWTCQFVPSDRSPAFIPVDSSPWDFWDPATNTNHANAIMTNPDMTAEKGRRYIDSIMVFVALRACIGLDLPCKASVVSSTKDLSDADVELSLSPNPASDRVRISVSKDAPILSATLTDINGKIVERYNNINSSFLEIQRNNLSTGMYIVNLNFEKGALSKKILFN